MTLAVFTPQNAAAQSDTWDGGGGDNNFGTGNNWVDNSSPSVGSGSTLNFAGTTRLTPFNNYTAWDDFGSWFFNSGAGAFTITGNAIDLWSKIQNDSSNTQIVDIDAIGSAGDFLEFNPVSGNLTIRVNDIFMNGDQLRVWGNNGNTLTFEGSVISGTGSSLAINENSVVRFLSAMTYTGESFINAGTLSFGTGGSANSSTIRLGNTSGSANATLRVEGGVTLSSGDISVRSGSSGTKTITTDAASGATATITRNVSLDADVTVSSTVAGGTLAFNSGTFDLKNQTMTVSGAGNVNFTNALSQSTGTGKLTMAGTGTLTLSGNNTYTGATTISSGQLRLGAADRISDSSALSVSTNAVLDMNNFNETVGSIAGAGTITMGSGQLIAGGDNSSTAFSGVMSGTGAFVKSGTGQLTLSGVNTYSGQSYLVNGTTLYTTAQGSSMTNTINIGETSGSDAATFALTNGITMSNAIIVRSGSSGLKTIQSLSTSGTNTIAGTVVNNSTNTSRLLLASGGTLHLSNVVSGAGGFYLDGGGTLQLSSSNTITGGLYIDNGTIKLRGTSANAGNGLLHIGAAASGSNAVVLFSGTGGGITASNTLTVNSGAGGRTIVSENTSGVNILNGTATLSNTLTISNAAGGEFRLGTASGSGGLTKEGAGTLQVSVSGSSMFSGNTTVNGGTLRLVNVTNTIPSMPSSTTLNNGSTLILTNAGSETRFGMTVDTLTFGASGGNSLVVNPSGGIIGGNGNNTFTTLGGTTNYITTSVAASFNMQGTAGRSVTFDVADGTGATDLQVDVAVINGGIIKKGAGVLTLLTNNTGITNLIISNGTLELAGAGRLQTGTFTTGISNNGTFAYSGNNNQTLSGVISGTGSITKTNSSTLILSASNAYTGATTINGGVVTISHSDALGTTAAGTTVASGAALALSNGITTAAEALSLSGTGISSGGALRNVSGDNTYSGTITNTSAARINSDTGTLTLSGAINATNQGLTFGGAGIVNVTGNITNSSAGLTKDGAGTTSLRGTNTYTGTTTINAGVLEVTNGAAIADTAAVSLSNNAGAIFLVSTNETIGSLQGGGGTGGNVNIVSGSTLTVAEAGSQTFSGVISNAGGLTKSGAGTTTLSGANTYTGATTVTQGTLAISANNRFGDTAVLVNGGTLNFGAFSDTVSSFTISSGTFTNGTLTAGSYALQGGTVAGVFGAGGITVSTGTTTLGSAGRLNTGSALTINSGQLTLGGAETVTSLAGSGGTLAMGANAFSSGGANTSTSYSGVLTGTGGFTKTGTGTLTLSGNSTGFTGTTTISGGGISVSGAGNLGANPGSAVTNQLTLNGGTLAVTTGYTANANAGMTVGASGGTVDVASSQRLIQGGGLYGAGNFTKTGQGTLSLTNTAGAYAGSVTVTNGVLQANTTLRGANISVGNSGTVNGSVLMGSGQVGTVTINTNGQISPGNSVGTLSVSNSLTFNGGGSYLWEITNTTANTPGVGWDLISVDTTAYTNGLGSLTIGGSGSFTVNGTAFGGFSFDGTQSYTGDYFQIVRAATISGSLSNLAFSGSGLGTGSWAFSTNATGLYLNYTAAGSTITFTNSATADQGGADIAGGNAAGAYATITNIGGATVVVISNTSPLTFTNEANSYTGATIIEEGTAVTAVNSANNANGAFGNAVTDIQVGSTNSGNANAATLLIGASGVTVGRGISINSGGTGLRTVGATNGSGTATYSGNIAMATNVTLSASNSGGTTLFSGVLSGAGNVTAAGSGTVVFSGINTYSGSTAVTNGTTLLIANSAALGGTGSGTTVQSGGALALSNGITSAEGITLSGTGIGSAGAIRNINGDNTLSGALALGAASRINSDTGMLTLSGGINGADFGLTVGGVGNTTISGNITNSSGGLTKDGSGSLVLSGANAYTGTTTINAGVLQATGGSAIADGGAVSLSNNAGAVFLVSASETIGSLQGGGGTGGNVSIASGQTLTVAETGAQTFSGVISNAGGLTKSGAGTLTLSQANTYTGATTISNGAIRISNASGLGTAAAGTTVVSGGALELAGGIAVASESLALNGTGVSSGGALRNISGDNTYGGAVTLGAASLITSDAGLLTVSGAINGANNNLTFLGAGNVAVSGAITNSSGQLIKGGASTLTLSGNNTYTGATTISNGSTIIAASGNALGATNGATTVSDGGFLAFSNATGFSSAENITIGNTAGGALRNLAGANTNSGTITLLADGTISVDAGGSLSLSNVSLTNANNRAVTLTGAGNSTLTGSVSSFSGSLTNNFIKDGSGTLTVNNNGTSGTAQLNIIGGTVTIAGGSLSTSTSTATRAIDLGISTVNATTNNVALYANSGVTVSNSIYVAPNSNSATRTIGTESGSGTATFNNEIYLGGDLTVSAAGGGTALFSGNLINAGNVTKTGAGTVILAGANTVVGTFTVGSGTLAITNGAAIANGNSVAFSNVAGATLRVNQSETVGAISGGGATGGTIDLATSQTLTTSFDSASSAYAGTLAGAGGLTKTGSGTLTLSGANGSYAGQITLVNGALLAGANNALGTGTLQIDFGSGGTRALASSSSTSYTLSNSVNLFFNDLTIGQTSGGTGSLTIGGSGKTFSLGNDAGANTRTITVNGTHTIAAQVTGDNKLAVSGGGTLALTGANTFSGGSQLNNGTILVGNNAALGTGTLQFDFAGGTGTRNLASVDSSSYTLANDFNLFFNALTLGQTEGGTGSLTLGASTNTFNLGSDGSSTTRTITVNGAQIIGAAVTGGANNNLNKAGSGTLVLAGDVSALGGTITNSAGRLQIGNGSTTGTIGNKNVTVASGADLAFNRSDNLSYSGIVSGTGGNLTQLGGGTLTLGGNNSFTGALTVANGTVSVGAANNLGNGTVTISNGGKLYTSAGFSASRAVTVGTGGGTIEVNTAGFTNTGGLNGTGNLIKSGLGTLSLTNTAGTYAGNITVTNGTLQANTTLRGANISVGNASTANGSVLMGSGSVGTVTINNNGQISPGNSVGTLTVSNSLTFNGGGSYLWEITNTTAATPGVGWDLISVDTGTVGAGSLTIGSDGQFTVAGTAINGFSFDTAASYTNNYFLIVRAASVSGSLGNLSFSGSGLGQSGNWSFSTGAEGLYLNYTAPSAGLVFTNTVAADQGDANLVTNNSAGAFATIADQGGVTAVTISNSAPLVFTNGANSYTGGTAIEQGTLVTIVNAGNTGGAFGTNAGAISLGSTNGGNANAATLLIGAAGVDVSKGIDVNAGGTGVRTIGATNSSGVATYSGNVVMSTNVTLSASNSAGTTLFSGTISGSGAITAAGSGTVTLAGANSFTNNVGIVSGATLVASNNSALGAGSGTTTVSNGATLALAGNINEDEAVTIAGTGVGGNGALRNISGANTNSGAVTLSANATIKAESGTRLSLNNVDITGAANRSVTFDGAGTNLVTGSISTAGGSLTNRIIKTGSGELIISNNGTTGTGQLRIGEGSVILAAGSLTTSTNTGVRAIDVGLSGDATGTNTAANATFLARSGVTVSNSIYIAPSGGDGSFTRTIGTDSTSGTVTYNNQMYLGHDVQITSAGTANLVYSGNITNDGTLNVTKIGAGSLTLSANNTWRGGLIAGEGTTILSGGNAVWDTNAVTVSNSATLALGASETIGSLAGAGTVTLGANSLVTGSNSSSTTYSGAIGGTGGIFKNGTGTFTLAGVNTYAGDTVVNGGTLAFSNGSVNSSIIRLGPDNSAGNTTILLSDSDGGTTVSSTLVVQADAGSTRSLVSSNSSGTNTFGGSIYLDGTATISQQAAGVFALTGPEIDVKSRTLTLSSVTNGNVAVSSTIFDSDANTGNIAKTGDGTVTLTGANAYAGTTLISGGTLQVGDGGATGQLGSGNITNNASLVVNRTGAISIGSTISGTGSLTKLAAGTLTLGGNNTYNGGTLVGDGALVGTTASLQGTITNNATVSFDQSTNGTYAGVMSGTGVLVKTNAGVLTLSGANTYSGGTVVGGGTLAGDTTSLQGAITNNATVSFDQSTSGTYAGAMSGTGALIKSSAGTLTLSGSNSYAGATTLSNGTVALGNANALAGGGAIAFQGGTLQYSASNTNDYSARITNSTSAVKIDTGGQNVTWASALNSTAASSGLTKEGSGTLVLNKGTSMFSGALTVNEGTLRVNNTQAQNNDNITSLNSMTTINNGSTLEFTQSSTEGRVKFAGGVTFGATGGNTLAMNTGAGTANSALVQGSYTFTTLGGTTNYIATSANAFFNMQGAVGRYVIFDVADGTGVTDLQVSMAVVDGGIMKKGAGVLTLTKDNTGITNLIISNGTLELAGAGRLNSGTFDVGISNNGTFAYSGTNNQTLSGAMSGTGDLVKNGNATLTLSGANTFSGGSTLSAGVLRVAHNSGLGTGALAALSNTVLEVTNGITVTNNLSVYSVKFLDGGNTLSGTITNNNTVYDVASGTTNTVSGFVTGAGGVELIGGGVLAITGTTNNYTGNTTISNGTLRISTLANSNTVSSIGVSNNVTLAGANATNAIIDYTGGNVSTDRAFVMNDGGGTINMATAATEMTLTGSASGTGKLIVGEGTLILSNATANSFAPGSIQVDSGATLQLAANNQIGDTTGLILNGGTFRVGTASTGFSDTLGTLTLSASSTIDLGAWTTGVRQLTFANSSSITWTGTLTITNWQGVALQSSSVAEILFGTGGLTSTQLGQVYWANQDINGGTLIGGGGELVPVPEPRVYAAAVALFAVVGWRERKRLLGLIRRTKKA